MRGSRARRRRLPRCVAPISIWPCGTAAAGSGPGTSRTIASPGRRRCSSCSARRASRLRCGLTTLRAACTRRISRCRISPRPRASRRWDRFEFQARLRRADGEWIWLDQRADIVEDPSTKQRRLVGIAVDVTERKREAEISATADQRLREAIEAISEAFVLVGLRQSPRAVQLQISEPAQAARRYDARRGVLRRTGAARPGAARVERNRRPSRRSLAARRALAHLSGAARRRALVAGQRAPHARRRLCLGRHRHHRDQTERRGIAEFRAAAAANGVAAQPVAPLAGGAGAADGDPRQSAISRRRRRRKPPIAPRRNSSPIWATSCGRRSTPSWVSPI